MRLISIFIHIIEQAIAIRDMINSPSPQRKQNKKWNGPNWNIKESISFFSNNIYWKQCNIKPNNIGAGYITDLLRCLLSVCCDKKKKIKTN